MPINNYIIATEPIGEKLAKKLIKRNCGVIDSRFMIDYYRFSEDYRLLFGGPETITSKNASERLICWSASLAFAVKPPLASI